MKDIAALVRGTARPDTGDGVHPAAVAAARDGDAYWRSGDTLRAHREFERALDLDRGHAGARYALGVLDALEGDFDSAARRLGDLLRDHPGYVDAWNALGNVNKLQRRWEEAATCYRRALELAPRLAAALSNLGICLRNSGREAEALDYLMQAAALEPTNLEIQFNSYLGMIDNGRVAEGEQGLVRVLAEAPEHAEAHLVLAIQLLASGRYADGWREYEWRNRIETWERRNAEYPYPWWRGEALADRRLLVRAEQGLGDQIMFASCLPELEQLGHNITVECEPRLVPVFARSFPGCAVCARRADGAAERVAQGWVPDLQVNIGSLPYLLGRPFPRGNSYLLADPVKVRAWRERLSGLGAGLKVGLSWRGGTWNTRQLARSIPLPELAPVLSVASTDFVSVQYGDCAADLAALARTGNATLHHWPEALDDYDETVALVAALDLVVSVQTTIVHLAGALGTPVWVMVPGRPEWRYGREGETMPWYASARLFRQDESSGWIPVISRIARELGQFTGRST